ncbi:MAG: toll/interleukin-1 receptor domain-containing protein [Butyrivibrio sp.]|nr:toll/interleukin-1 receptor domain-containing protein [Butyrivibrio sp.]
MKYDAFISYRHLEQDMFVAKGVHKALETAKIPRKIQKETGVKRIKRVFRDQEELPIGSDLTHNIDYALRESGFLIVICSPQTKESLWVMKEIDTFIALHGRENVLAVLVDGEPVDSFPHQLCVDEEGNPVEPLAADVRGKTKSEVRKKIKSESLRLAAAILHCDYDDLKQRHKERQMRRFMAIAAGVAVLGVAFGVYNAYNLKRINENYQQKLVNESKVLAGTSLDVLKEGDRATAGLIALRGLPVEDQERPFVSDCMYALEQATGAYSNGDNLVFDKVLKHGLSVDNMRNSADGTMILSYDQQDNVYFWDAETGDILFLHNVEYIDGERNEVAGLSVCDDKYIIASNKYLTAYNKDESVAYDVKLPGNGLYAEFSADDELVAICELDNIEVYNLADGSLVANFENSLSDSYTRRMKFSDDKSYLLASHLFDSKEGAVCSVLNIKTGEELQLPLAERYIMDLRFSCDDCALIATMDSDNLYTNGEYPMYVQKFNYKTGDLIWQRELTYNNYGMNTSYTYVRDRNYTDSNGVAHPETFVSCSRKLYTLDTDTGMIISTFDCPSDIEKFYIGASVATVFVTGAEGRMYTVNGTTGYNYSDHTIELSTGTVVDVLMGFSRVVVQEYRSPNVKIMTYNVDESLEEMEVPGLRTVDYFGSPDETTFVLEAEQKGDSDKSTYLVYDTETGTKKGSFDLDQFYNMKSFYSDGDTVVVPGVNGAVYVYSISKDDLEQYKLFDEDTRTSKFMTSVNKRFIALCSTQTKVFDIQTRQIAGSATPQENFFDGIISNDGKRIYGYDYDYRFMYMDVATGAQEHPLPDYTVTAVALNWDDTMAALVCSDGQLRIFDTSNWKIVDALEFHGNSNNLVVFSTDGDKLFLQGMDLYFKIYDMSEHLLVFSSDEQLLDIDEVNYDAENDIVALSNYTDMYVVDVAGNSFIHKAALGKIFFPQKQTMICASSDRLYKFKVKTLDDLVQAFRDEFGYIELTDEQSLIYNIDR